MAGTRRQEITDPTAPRLGPVVRPALRTFLRARRPLIAAAVAIKLVILGLGTALSTFVLARVLARTGTTAVTNNDIARFLLTPWAILGVILVAMAAVALAVAEQSVLTAVAARCVSGRRRTFRGVVIEASVALARVLRLGALLTTVLAGALLPAVAGTAVVYRTLLSGHDINYYLAGRPPEFRQALGIVAAIVLLTAAALAFLYIRWVVAIPIALFEGGSARKSLAESGRRVRGARWRIAGILAGWHLTMFALGAGSAVAFRFMARGVLGSIGTGTAAVSVSVILLFLVQAGLVAAVSFVTATGHALVVLAVYVARRSEPGAGHFEEDPSAAPIAAQLAGRGRFLIAAAVALVVVTVALAGRVAALLRVQERTQITAHRGYSRVAPENTLAAIRKAIEAGSDWAEIDVQETADGIVVVLHDRDLMRLAGDPRRLADLRYDELRTLDVGSRFSPEFAGERVPRLDEVIDAARGRMKLNIELKYYGPDPRLARDVGRILREQKFEGDCFVASLEYGSLREARAENPSLRTAAIVTVALGDIVRLDVDVLSVRADLVTRRLLRSAHVRGKEVHVWTVDDERTAEQLMERGVDNVITNDPPKILGVRRERAALTGAERLLVAFRSYFGLEPDKPALAQPPGEL